MATLGVETDTGDRTGTVLKTNEVSVTLDEVKAAAAKLTGPIKQLPPMYSALKRDGVALYRLARQGETVEREPRLVTIYRFDILSLDGNTVEMECVVSKGTYLRTLIEDLGHLLGCGATMSALCRTRVGDLDLKDAITLETLEREPDAIKRRAMLRPPDELIQSLAPVELAAAETERFKNGQRLALHLAERGRVRVYGPGKELLGTATVNERGVLAPERLIATD